MYKSFLNKNDNKVYMARCLDSDEHVLINESKTFAKRGEWIIKNGDELQILSDAAFKMSFSPVEKKLLLD